MRVPTDLDSEAKAYWKRHASRLQGEGLLTEATFDSFVLLCRTHSILAKHDPSDTADKMAVIKWIGLAKIYSALARGFSMNSDKPRKAEVKGEADEFGWS